MIDIRGLAIFEPYYYRNVNNGPDRANLTLRPLATGELTMFLEYALFDYDIEGSQNARFLQVAHS